MQRYVFSGSVLPERTLSNFDFNLKSSDGLELKIQCLLSKITIDLTCDNSNYNLHTLKNIAESFSRTAMDSMGFATGCGFDVDIFSAYNLVNDQFTIFGVHENIFETEKINIDTDKGMFHPDMPLLPSELAVLAVKNTQLNIALADFRESMRNPDFSAFYCYRAIEALKHSTPEELLKNEEEDSREYKRIQWFWLRDNLNLQKVTIEKVQTAASKQRHGQLIPQTWEQRKEQMSITWETIRRYTIYLTQPDKIKELKAF